MTNLAYDSPEDNEAATPEMAALQALRPVPRISIQAFCETAEVMAVMHAVAEDRRGLYVRGRLSTDVEQARDIRALLADGALNGLSIGFRTVRARRIPGGRELLEVELWEISVVTFPLLAGSTVTSIGASPDLARVFRQGSAVMRAAE